MGKRKRTEGAVSVAKTGHVPKRRKKLVKKRNVDVEKSDSAGEGPMDEAPSMDGMEQWVWLGVPAPLLKGLHELGFKVPTPIQKKAISTTRKTKSDVIGAAETGSGKTLAFGIPVLMDILRHSKHSPATKSKRTCKNKPPLPVKPEGDVVDLNHVWWNGQGGDMETPDEGVAGEDIVSDGDKGSVDNDQMDVADGGVVSDDEEGGDEVGVADGSEEGVSDDDQMCMEGVDSDMEEEGVSDDSQLGVGDGGDWEGVSSEEEAGMSDRVGVADDAKLITVRDCIPDDEFEAMLTVKPGKATPMGGASDAEHPQVGQPPAAASAMETDAHPPQKRRGLVALILAPTRELAMQIHMHMTQVAKYTGVQVCPIVGGMAKKKQERLLAQQPAIVVATVGRLWQFMKEGEPHLCFLDDLKYLILDEADRMVEFSHFQDMWNILDKLRGARSHVQRRNLVFSATLTISKRIAEGKKKRRLTSRQDVMDKLIRQIGMKDDAAVVDLTGSKVVVESLTETKIMCTAESKSVFLYYFLLRYPGRTVVFVNTIKCLHRVRSLLELLQLKPLPLHANMQQRQRLNNLDRFNADPRGLLVASDVAARGLDFPNVEHIIHYQVPMNTELYVHRSGRTARAQHEGLSVILVSPEDLKSYRNICHTLNKDVNLKEFPVDSDYMKPLNARVSLARQIHDSTFRQSKVESWFARSAKALDIELDEDLCADSGSKRQQQHDVAHLSRLKAELAALLRRTVMPRSLSRKFPTREENHQLLDGYRDMQSKVLVSKAAPKSALLAVVNATQKCLVTGQQKR